MRRTQILAVAIALLAISPLPVLADEMATGTVTKIDPSNLTLDTGQTFDLAVDMSSVFKVGEKVIVAFVSMDGKMMATTVQPATAPGGAGPSPTPAGN